MISKSMSCDRCGKKIENNKGCYNENYALRDSSAKITLWGVGEARSTFGQRIDLCEDCYISFIDWIEESEVTERREGVEESPADSSTPSVTDSKGDRQ